jgi:hypothetical protein
MVSHLLVPAGNGHLPVTTQNIDKDQYELVPHVVRNAGPRDSLLLQTKMNLVESNCVDEVYSTGNANHDPGKGRIDHE